MRRKMTWSERLYRRFIHKFYSHDLLIDLQLHAKKQTIEYILENMADAMMYVDRWDLMEQAVQIAPSEGLILEFGVADGASVNHIAAQTQRSVHGFDSFEGLPEQWSGTFEKAGKFSRQGSLPKVVGNVSLHKGLFSDTLPPFLAEKADPVALAHIDCDIYSSTRDVLALLSDRFVPGTVLVFDEYFNYPNWRAHEFKAFKEFLEATGWRYEYVGFTRVNGHVMVRLVGL